MTHGALSASPPPASADTSAAPRECFFLCLCFFFFLSFFFFFLCFLSDFLRLPRPSSLLSDEEPAPAPRPTTPAPPRCTGASRGSAPPPAPASSKPSLSARATTRCDSPDAPSGPTDFTLRRTTSWRRSAGGVIAPAHIEHGSRCTTRCRTYGASPSPSTRSPASYSSRSVPPRCNATFMSSRLSCGVGRSCFGGSPLQPNNT